ncbi:MAG: 30S ribosomal protein S16 [Candidatus Omnitrophica bacterium]|nr:30S ribosomal protein S16 [Candidatus Omnitrophota bacterium]
MVVIRLQRRGTKKAPAHRIVVADRAKAQGGRALEILGYYDPSYNPPKFSLNESRLTFWTSSGAQVSEALARLIKHFKKQLPALAKN